MPDRKHILITGANRGIGKCLLSTYLSRTNHSVIAALRDPASSSSKELQSLPRGRDSELILVKLDSAKEADATVAVQYLLSKHNIQKLDVVVANAGISAYFGKATVTPAKEMYEHFKINTVAPLLLFQATASLLNSAETPRFIVISSSAGSLSGVKNLPVENTAYGTSKAGVNFVTRRIHYENPALIAFSINPGWLQTDLGNHAARGIGMAAAPVPVNVGVNGIIEQIDNSTRDRDSGKFLNYDGSEIDW
ncbi:uncharacterized protein N7484_000958 [Penicillium longicatenatum]|uniref:uncharacterized protein n=1 Tax=Penicillium longicatenatum TaxID=1561947 RepID=UPI0025490212|nr:uncharacterized protein N7484_000958 [Penicillium longicatenatum]KAJ5657309.1 hypothetical protein N7484_000958 [Penicillium longicatenatum]